MSTATNEMPIEQQQWLENFVAVYQQLNKHNLHLLAQIYHRQIQFIDPLHQVDGISALTHYFGNMYQNIDSCEFVIEQSFSQGNSAALYWQMHLVHPRLNDGKSITVNGHSHLRLQQNKVIYHRDYFDLGEMLYQQLPLIGSLIRYVNKKASQ